MAYFNLPPGIQLYYEDHGHGQPILFIHGLWASSRFYQKQLTYFGQRYRAIAPDLRGHGRSQHTHAGNTVATHAQDVHALVHGMRLTDVVLVGWSMGAFVLWEYFKQFGADNVKATVIIDESPSDFKWADWPFGAFDFPTLCHLMAAVQTDRAAVVRDILSELFNTPLRRMTSHGWSRN